MDVKGESTLQLFNKSKLRNGNKTFLEPNFSLFIVKFKKFGFKLRVASLIYLSPGPLMPSLLGPDTIYFLSVSPSQRTWIK